MSRPRKSEALDQLLRHQPAMAEQEVVDLCENDSDMDELMAFPGKVPHRMFIGSLSAAVASCLCIV